MSESFGADRFAAYRHSPTGICLEPVCATIRDRGTEETAPHQRDRLRVDQ